MTVTDRLPILVYHRIATDGAPGTARYRVAPAAFAEQLAYLRDAGFETATLEEWRRAVADRAPLAGRRIVLTFDDGYRDFAEAAWPLLRRHGLSAIVFVVAGVVEGISHWRHRHGEAKPLMGWDEIRSLQDEGVHFGAHSMSHRALPGLSRDEVDREAREARALLALRLGETPTAFAYPYGEYDSSVARVVGECGYAFGLTCAGARAGFEAPLLELPRIEIAAGDGLREFIAKVEKG